MKIKFIYIMITNILLIANTLHPDEYPYRDISKPLYTLPQDVRIYQAAPPRTGSTLIYNVLQYLFEDNLTNNSEKKIIKLHNFNIDANNKDEIYVVITIRNPLDTLTSTLLVIENHTNQKFELTKENLDALANVIIDEYIEVYNYISKVNNTKTLVLNYENFVDNFEYIYSSFEDFFSITIDEQTREQIKKHFNINSMKILSSKYENFSYYHPHLGIHGNHINNANWKIYIPSEFHEYLLDKFYTILKLFHYPVNYVLPAPGENVSD